MFTIKDFKKRLDNLENGLEEQRAMLKNLTHDITNKVDLLQTKISIMQTNLERFVKNLKEL
jgi:uncharacterized coiled-coil protein SlyX